MAADPRDLVTLDQVQTWLNSNTPGAMNLNTVTKNIPLAITDCSVDWLSFTGRRCLNRFIPCNDFFDGAGGERQFLRDFPCALVGGVWVNGTSVSAGNVNQNGSVTPGWVLDSKRESLSFVGNFGGGFGLGRGPGGTYAASGGPFQRQYRSGGFGQRNDNNFQNVQIQYFGGGSVMLAETAQVAAETINPSQKAVFYCDLNQVYYAQPQNGQLVQFVEVASAPAQGQYSVAADGTYTFNAADNGKFVSISYAYNEAMPDVQMACIMQVCETLYTRTSIGLRSQGSPESGTTMYSKVARPERVLEVMRKYKRAMVGV